MARAEFIFLHSQTHPDPVQSFLVNITQREQRFCKDSSVINLLAIFFAGGIYCSESNSLMGPKEGFDG